MIKLKRSLTRNKFEDLISTSWYLRIPESLKTSLIKELKMRKMFGRPITNLRSDGTYVTFSVANLKCIWNGNELVKSKSWRGLALKMGLI